MTEKKYVLIYCPGCGKMLRRGNLHNGQRITCSGCNAVAVVTKKEDVDYTWDFSNYLFKEDLRIELGRLDKILNIVR